jgi:hypothetical protein
MHVPQYIVLLFYWKTDQPIFFLWVWAGRATCSVEGMSQLPTPARAEPKGIAFPHMAEEREVNSTPVMIITPSMRMFTCMHGQNAHYDLLV